MDKHAGGRPSMYDSIDLAQVQKLAAYGLIEKEIADIIGISLTTLKTYKNKHEQFLSAIKAGKEVSDSKVVKSLFKRACGYEYIETHVEKKGELTKLIKTITKQVNPDTLACIFWLKNRLPEDWRDRIEHTGKDGESLGMLVKVINKEKTNGKTD